LADKLLKEVITKCDMDLIEILKISIYFRVIPCQINQYMAKWKPDQLRFCLKNYYSCRHVLVARVPSF